MTSCSSATIRPKLWLDAGLWNIYFLGACILHWMEYISIKPLENALLLIFVIFPLSNSLLKGLRLLVAVIVAISLLWSESWLPGPDVLLENLENLSNFTPAYLLELTHDFINTNMVLAILISIIAWVFLHEWLRFTTFSILSLIFIAFPGLLSPFIHLMHDDRDIVEPTSTAIPNVPQNQFRSNNITTPLPLQTGIAHEEQLSAWLQSFFEEESKRQTRFNFDVSKASNFDIAVLNICSLSKDDLEASGLSNHPVFSKFDITFDSFNSATAYSGPATLRLVTGACGQPSHGTLYNGRRQECEWMTILEKAGWKNQLVMDHNGAFDNYLQHLRNIGGVSAPLMDQSNIQTQYEAFDGTAILRTSDVFNQWLKTRNESSTSTMTLFNIIALHDGNRRPGTSASLPFKPRAEKMLDDLDDFIKTLDKISRPLMLIVVPEHGAAVRGDKVQVARLREIPSPAITNIPVYVKFVGLENKGAPRVIKGPTSYLALTELIARTIDNGLYQNIHADHKNTLDHITKNLPLTWAVSENSSAVVIPYGEETWVKLKNGRWLKYRQ